MPLSVRPLYNLFSITAIFTLILYHGGFLLSSSGFRQKHLLPDRTESAEAKVHFFTFYVFKDRFLL